MEQLFGSGNTVADTNTGTETVPTTNSEPVADVFAALSDPLRIEIIRALSDHHREASRRDEIAFSTVRKAVGTVDSG